MLELYENIRRFRLAKKMSQAELAKLTGYNDRSSIAKIEKGDVDLAQSKIMLFAKALGVDAGTLMGNTGLNNSPSLPPYENIRPLKTQRLPVLGEIAAGKPIYMNEEREVYVETEVKADYLLIARGNSMTGARINDGDIVFIREQPMVENGEIAAVAIGDEATLKRFYYYKDKGMLILKPANPDYEDQIYSGDELDQVHVLGKAVYFQSIVI